MKKILVVDDQFAAARLLVALLKLDGYEARHVMDWQNLVAEVEVHRPDLVLLDVHLPDVDGFELLKQIREYADPEVSTVPVLFISALDYGHRLETSGADGFLLKPFQHRDLLDAIEAVKEARGLA